MAEPTRRRTHAGAGKTGMCVNKECDNYRKTVNVTHGDFVCPECGKTLAPIKQSAPIKMWVWGIIGAVVIAAAVAVYLFSQLGSSEPETVAVPVDSVETPAAPVDTAKSIEENAAALVAADSLKLDSVKTAEIEKEKKPVSETPKPVVSALPYGKYTGPMKGGKPDGVGGSVVVNRSYTFDLNDGTTVTVGNGDKIENTKFQAGRLIQGEIQRSNGDRKWITLGAANGR